MAARIFSTFTKISSNNVRQMSSAASAGEHGSISRWRNLTFFVAIPGCVLGYINAHLKEKEHEEHFVRPEFVKYEHLYTRTKKFPWGDGNHTLFHNPKVNALPEGYEDDE